MALNSLQKFDLPVIISHGLRMASESPVYKTQVHDPEYTLDYLTRAYDAGILIGCVADGGCMFGSIGGTWATPTLQAVEWMLYVAPELRGSGLAVRLIKRFEEQARERGAQKIIVGSSTGINDAGVLKLYARLGYTARGATMYKEL